MRWKEKFVLPDHKVKNIHGASFAGFYYVLLDFSAPLSSPSFDPYSSRPLSISPPPRAFGLSPALSPPSPRIPPPLTRTPSTSSTDEASAPEQHSIHWTSSPPSRPRRASSASLSYASVLRGSPPTTPEPGTPKDLEPSSPIVIPIPLGQHPSDFPAPSSPPLVASTSWGRGNGRRMEGRGGARSLDALVCDEEDGGRRNGRCERRGSGDKEREKESFGMKSRSRATMTG